MQQSMIAPIFAVLCLQYGAYAARLQSPVFVEQSANDTSDSPAFIEQSATDTSDSPAFIEQSVTDTSEQKVDGRKPNMQVRAMMMRTRQCIEEKASQFPELMQRFGKWTPDPERDASLLKLVIGKWIAEDLMENHLGNYNAVKRLISKWRSPKVKNWKHALKGISNQISDLGFNYDAAESSCKHGWTEDMQNCLVQKAIKFQESSPLLENDPLDLARWINTTLFYEEVHLHSHTAHIAIPSLHRLHNLIKASDFPYSKMVRACKRASDYQAHELIEFLDKEVARTNRDTSHCGEDPKKGFCPEGLTPKVARPFDVRKASAAAGITFAAAGPGTLGVGAGVGFVLGGAAGVAQGLAVASTVHVGPVLAGLAYVVFGTGRRQCMCTPRECMFDVQAGGCVMSEGEIPSHNPYGRSLPFLSRKCVLSRTKKDHCEIQSCDVMDFTPKLSNIEDEYNGKPVSATLYGKVGRQQDGGIYNCLSSSGHVTDSLMLETKIPGTELDNTAMNRAEIFEDLGVAAKMDSAAR